MKAQRGINKVEISRYVEFKRLTCTKRVVYRVQGNIQMLHVYLISPQLVSGIQPTGRSGTKRKPKKHM
jgi:hypothetical protein